MTADRASQLRSQIPASNDPDRLERMAREGEARVEHVARALYDLDPFYMPAGYRIDGNEVARGFSFDEAPAYRQEEARRQARVAIAAIAGFRA